MVGITEASQVCKYLGFFFNFFFCKYQVLNSLDGKVSSSHYKKMWRAKQKVTFTLAGDVHTVSPEKNRTCKHKDEPSRCSCFSKENNRLLIYTSLESSIFVSFHKSTKCKLEARGTKTHLCVSKCEK